MLGISGPILDGYISGAILDGYISGPILLDVFKISELPLTKRRFKNTTFKLCIYYK